MMRHLVLFVFLSAAAALFSQENKNSENQSPLAFNQAKFDLLQQAAVEDSIQITESGKKKSGIQAALFSAILPGAGQYYTKNYWRAALYAGLEIAFWGAYASYEKKGDDVDATMRAYADEHWEENRYWSYIYQTGVIFAQANPSSEIARKVAELNLPHDYVSAPDIEEGQILVLFPGYDRDDLEFLVTANQYTHDLPRTHTQQYYEMIYKYLHQFGVGWDDVYSYWGDPFYYDRPGAPLTALTPNIVYYRDLRNESNDHYQTATTMLNLVLLNHLVSAVDAAFSARLYNKHLDYSLNVGAKRSGDQLVNTLGLTLRF